MPMCGTDPMMTNWLFSAALGTPGASTGVATLAVATNHDLHVVWNESRSGPTVSTNVFLFAKAPYPWTNFTSTNFLTLNWPSSPHLKRSNSSDTDDAFRTPILATLCANPANNSLYLGNGSGMNNDIFFALASL